MSLTTTRSSIESATDEHLPPVDPARVCAAWAASGEFGDHVVYEQARRWTFAGGVRARIILTASGAQVAHGEMIVEYPAAASPATTLATVLAELDIPDWRVFGWVGFDFCADHYAASAHVGRDAVLAHLIVPEFEAVVDDAGIDTGNADPVTAARLFEIAAAEFTPGKASPVAVGLDADDYRGRVATAIEEIGNGAYAKVILSRQVPIPFAVDMPATYALGRAGNNPARSFLLSLDGFAAAGFSPELVVAVDAERGVVTEPLAGTRALGRSAELDASARDELRTDAKEIAEHAISVRACFEEIASVATAGSTAVSEFMVIRERGSVQHLASTVRGMLSEEADAWQALAVLFPSITASGIPKAPAIDAIYRLEPHRRGLYSGAVLTASSAGDLEATLALRTVYSEGERSWLCAGAGVVGQSTPDREFEETCEKLASVAPFVVAASPRAAAGELS
ncbi:salicylate synthase [Gordonia sp. ABSL1-1]|uniref:salicylate synthase n=1 Tax=Gordonia sp. ABSL1-1 TaxID=3053923 RepID=UPI00257449E7|nr:salicylate synthase [Gordonia sp. ABSL1-1]MDL9937479.1 salicylate synthase [Gordonia sp. ABSL1-1]